jgi:hypothetical protein
VTLGDRTPISLQALVADIDTRKAASLLSPPMTATSINYFRQVSIVTAILFSVAGSSRAQTSAEAEPNSLIVSTLLDSPQQAVLLKKTDRVMVGAVRLNGHFYEIEIADESRVSIPRDQVEFVGANAEEVYQYKCRGITRWKTGDHFQITRWCIQNKLLVHAIDHFEEVERQSPNHPSVKQLGAELQQKILSDESFRVFAGLPPLTTATVAAANPKAVGNVSLASATSQIAEHPQVSIYFNDRIQPILMNRCSQSACHGATSNNALRLLEPRGKAYASVSSENLKHVLAMVAPDESETPRLLSYATKAHGTQRLPAIALTETALIEELKKWIRFSENPVVPAVATHNPLATIPTASSASATSPSVTSPSVTNTRAENSAKLNPLSPGSSQLRAVPGSSSQVEFPAGLSKPTVSEIDALDAQLDKILSKQMPKSSAARDPFDPAEFNRQAEKQGTQPR